MPKFLSITLVVFLLSSCAPRIVPAADPIFYQAASTDIYAAVIQAISTSPGLDDSNGWIISHSDSVGGFVEAQTTVSPFFTEPVSHTMTVVVGQNTHTKVQVVVQGSQEAQTLMNRVVDQLDQKFPRAN